MFSKTVLFKRTTSLKQINLIYILSCISKCETVVYDFYYNRNRLGIDRYRENYYVSTVSLYDTPRYNLDNNIKLAYREAKKIIREKYV